MNTNETKWIRGRFICGDGHPLPINCTHPDTIKIVEEADAVIAKMMQITIVHRADGLPPLMQKHTWPNYKGWPFQR